MSLDNPLYTGQNTGVRLDDGGQLERARAGMSNKMMAASQAQAQFSKEERDAFLDALDTETVALASENQLKQQGTMIEEYNKKYGNLYKERNGRLTMQDKVQMAADKKRLEGWQKQSMATQERWKTDKAQILRNPNYYDKDAFFEAEKTFLETGEYPMGALQAKPVDPNVAFRSMRIPEMGSSSPFEDTIKIDGVSYLRKGSVNMSEEEARVLATGLILEDEAKIRWAAENFSKLPLEEKKKYLDVDGDGKVSEDEKRAADSKIAQGNPVLQWAVAQ